MESIRNSFIISSKAFNTAIGLDQAAYSAYLVSHGHKTKHGIEEEIERLSKKLDKEKNTALQLQATQENIMKLIAQPKEQTSQLKVLYTTLYRFAKSSIVDIPADTTDLRDHFNARFSAIAQTYTKADLASLSRLVNNLSKNQIDRTQKAIEGRKLSLNNVALSSKKDYQVLYQAVKQHTHRIPKAFLVEKNSFLYKLSNISNEYNDEHAKNLTELFQELSKLFFEKIINAEKLLNSINSFVHYKNTSNRFSQNYQHQTLVYFILIRYQDVFSDYFSAISNCIENGKRNELISLIGVFAHAINLLIGSNFSHDPSGDPIENEEDSYKEQNLKAAIDIILLHCILNINSNKLSMLYQALNSPVLTEVFELGVNSEIIDDTLSSLKTNIDDRFKRQKVAQQLSESNPGIRSLEELYAYYKNNFLAECKKTNFYALCSCSTELPSPLMELTREKHSNTRADLTKTKPSSTIKQLINKVYDFSGCEGEQQTLTFFETIAELIKKVESEHKDQVSTLSPSQLSKNRNHKISEHSIFFTLAMLDKFCSSNLSNRQIINKQRDIAKYLYNAKDNPILLYYYRSEGYLPLLPRASFKESSKMSSAAVLTQERKVFFNRSEKLISVKALSPQERDNQIDKAASHYKKYLYLHRIKSLLNSSKHQAAGKKTARILGKTFIIGGKSDGREKFEAIIKDIEQYADYSENNAVIIQEKCNQASSLKSEKNIAYQPGRGYGVRTKETVTLYKEIYNVKFPDPAPIISDETEEEELDNRLSECSYIEQKSNADSKKHIKTPDNHASLLAAISPAVHKKQGGYAYSSLINKQREKWTENNSGSRTGTPSPEPLVFPYMLENQKNDSFLKQSLS